jgi:hypothetical protein
MSLIINKVSSSSVQITYNYLESDEIFGYDVSATYKIDFADISYINADNILYEGVEALREAYLRPNLVARIGADEFINGRITAQDFEESSSVGNSSCSITIQESKRLDDYSGSDFAQYIPSPQWMESFQETFSFSRNAGAYSSTRNVSLKYKQDAGNQFLNNARLFLRNFYFNSRPNVGNHVDGISENGRFNGGFRPLVSETFDLIGLSVSLQENLETAFIDGDHSKKESYSLNLDEGGFLNKKYSVEIKAIKEPLEVVAENACKSVISTILAANLAQFGKPIEIGRGVNKDGGLITVNISFSNNPSLNASDNITYSVTRTRRESFYDYSFSAELISDGKNQIEKAIKVRAYWQTQISSYKAKVLSLFSEATTIYEQSHSFSFQYLTAKISDSAVFTNDPAYDTSGLPQGIIKRKFSNSYSPKIDRTKIFLDIVDKKEKIELTEFGLSTVGKGTFSMEAVAFKSKGLFFSRDYLESINFNIGETTYKNSDEITVNEDGSTSRVISYDFI